MQIGIIHGELTTLGGAEKVALSLIKGLKKSGHEVNLYFTDATSDKTIETIFGDLLNEVKVHKVSQLKMPSFRIYNSLVNRILLTKAGNKDDIVIETSGALKPLWFSNRPYVAYCNGIDDVSSREMKKKYVGWLKLYWYPYSKLYAFAARRTSDATIVSNSQYTRELVKKIVGIDSQVIYPPVEINLFRFDRVNTRSKIVIFSRFAPEKNYELAVRVAEILSDQEFIFAGSIGDAHYYEKVNRSIVDEGLQQRIKIIPDAPIDVLRRILGEAKVYLHCRYNEPFGITVVEAIAAGCIPVVPDCSAHKETVPFPELRFLGVEEASEKVKNAMEGQYDALLPKLQAHINQFDEKTFQEKMIELLNSAH